MEYFCWLLRKSAFQKMLNKHNINTTYCLSRSRQTFQSAVLRVINVRVIRTNCTVHLIVALVDETPCNPLFLANHFTAFASSIICFTCVSLLL